MKTYITAIIVLAVFTACTPKSQTRMLVKPFAQVSTEIKNTSTAHNSKVIGSIIKAKGYLRGDIAEIADDGTCQLWSNDTLYPQDVYICQKPKGVEVSLVDRLPTLSEKTKKFKKELTQDITDVLKNINIVFI